MSTPRHIVILGGTGFVGRHLVQRLHEDSGLRITVLSRNRELLRDLAVLPRVQLLNCNVYAVDELAQRLQGASAAINLIGVLQSDGFGGAGFYRAHVALTETLIAACRKAGVRRLLQMSSLRAGEGESHYLKSRGQAEALVKNSGLDWTLFQPSVIFGRGDGLFCRFAPLLRLAPVLPLARAGARFQPVYVKDVAEAMARALDRADSIGKTYPLVGPSTYSLAGIVRYTARCLGLRRLVLPLPDAIGALQGLAFDALPAGLKPFSSDNYRSLKLDSISSRNGLEELGIQATPLEMVVPEYLGRGARQGALDDYRRGPDV